MNLFNTFFLKKKPKSWKFTNLTPCQDPFCLQSQMIALTTTGYHHRRTWVFKGGDIIFPSAITNCPNQRLIFKPIFNPIVKRHAPHTRKLKKIAKLRAKRARNFSFFRKFIENLTLNYRFLINFLYISTVLGPTTTQVPFKSALWAPKYPSD